MSAPTLPRLICSTFASIAGLAAWSQGFPIAGFPLVMFGLVTVEDKERPAPQWQVVLVSLLGISLVAYLFIASDRLYKPSESTMEWIFGASRVASLLLLAYVLGRPWLRWYTSRSTH